MFIVKSDVDTYLVNKQQEVGQEKTIRNQVVVVADAVLERRERLLIVL